VSLLVGLSLKDILSPKLLFSLLCFQTSRAGGVVGVGVLSQVSSHVEYFGVGPGSQRLFVSSLLYLDEEGSGGEKSERG